MNPRAAYFCISNVSTLIEWLAKEISLLPLQVQVIDMTPPQKRDERYEPSDDGKAFDQWHQHLEQQRKLELDQLRQARANLQSPQ